MVATAFQLSIYRCRSKTWQLIQSRKTTFPIRGILWHPDRPVFAAHGDDQIVLYNHELEELWHQQRLSLKACAWSTSGNGMFLVGPGTLYHFKFQFSNDDDHDDQDDDDDRGQYSIPPPEMHTHLLSLPGNICALESIGEDAVILATEACLGTMLGHHHPKEIKIQPSNIYEQLTSISLSPPSLPKHACLHVWSRGEVTLSMDIPTFLNPNLLAWMDGMVAVGSSTSRFIHVYHLATQRIVEEFQLAQQHVVKGLRFKSPSELMCLIGKYNQQQHIGFYSLSKVIFQTYIEVYELNSCQKQKPSDDADHTHQLLAELREHLDVRFDRLEKKIDNLYQKLGVSMPK